MICTSCCVRLEFWYLSIADVICHALVRLTLRHSCVALSGPAHEHGRQALSATGFRRTAGRGNWTDSAALATAYAGSGQRAGRLRDT